MSGLFVTFEGADGSGKSTQVGLLRDALAAEGDPPVCVREPGGTELGERVRDLLLHGEDMSAEAEMHLYMAARSELLDRVVRPALTAGRIVVADRYHDSTLAYQGGGRGVATWWPESYPRPDRTFLFAVPPEEAMRRRMGESAADRLEREPLAFHRAVAAAYDRLAAREPGRWVVLDGTRPAGDLHGEVLTAVRSLRRRTVESSS